MSRRVSCTSCGETGPHGAHGWCQRCYRRWRYYGRPAGGPPPVRRIEHDDVRGTVQGWNLHMRRGTEPCGPCRTAHNADVRAWHQVNSKGRARSMGWQPEQLHTALITAGNAEGVDDCRALLQMLGLVPSGTVVRDRIGGAV